MANRPWGEECEEYMNLKPTIEKAADEYPFSSTSMKMFYHHFMKFIEKDSISSKKTLIYLRQFFDFSPDWKKYSRYAYVRVAQDGA